MNHVMNVLALFAHPDDAEFLAAGTLAHLASSGAKVSIATMTAGDCGTAVLPAAKISQVRLREAVKSAALIGAEYICLGEKDLEIFYDRRTLRKVTGLVRRVDPSMVFTHSPEDYMLDHETTSRLCQTACFGAMAPNFASGPRQSAKPIRAIPHLYYSEPFGGRNIFGKAVRSNLFVNIASTLDLKTRMLSCHESQRAFLEAQQGIPDLLGMLRQAARQAGEISGFEQAEGFRQHLGQGFPSNNLLGEILGNKVRLIEK